MPFDQAVGAVLTDAVTETSPDLDALAAAAADGGEQLVAAAYSHGVTGYLWRAVNGLSIPPALRERLGVVRDATVAHHLRTVVDLRHLAGVLDGAGVEWLVVKGPVLTEHYHGAVDLRGYTDLDVLVRPDHFPAALDLLAGSGCEILDRNWALLLREAKGEVHLRLPFGCPLDLHWHLLNSRAARRGFDVPIREVFQRAVTVQVNGLPVRTLEPVDTFVYLSLHTLLSGAQRLIWVKDLERVVASGVDGAELVHRARRWRAELAVTAAMDLVTATLGATPPEGFAPRRTPGRRAWLAVATARARRAPVASADGTGSSYSSLMRALRPTVAGSLRALAARRATNASARLRRVQIPRTADGRLDPTYPGSDRFDAGGPAARDGFLRQVARQG